MQIEVVYSQMNQVHLLKLRVEENVSIESILNQLSLDLHSFDGVGIWGQPASLATLLKEGDRLELYHALRQDPKQLRRKRSLAR